MNNCRNCGAPLSRRITCDYCGSYNTELQEVSHLGDVYDVDMTAFEDDTKPSFLALIPMVGPLLFRK